MGKGAWAGERGVGGGGGGGEVGGGEALFYLGHGLWTVESGVVRVLGGAEVGDGALEAGLEEEEGGPACGVAEEVWRQAAVEGGEGAVGAGEGADEGDG